ncbi:CRAL-TRIO domain-containing protein [Pavlovales sp. CCMP2436]|nr:CRAL-TRIO domain-containing protein [Pavlovales sp. CCMP2436]
MWSVEFALHSGGARSERESRLELALLLTVALLLGRLEVLLRRIGYRFRAADGGVAEQGGASHGQRPTRAADELGTDAQPLAADEQLALAPGALPARLFRTAELTVEQAEAAALIEQRLCALLAGQPDLSGQPRLAGLLVEQPSLAAFALDSNTLARYILARVRGPRRLPDVEASWRLLQVTLSWRAHARLDLPPSAAMREHAETGKAYVGGLDVHGRPCVVLDCDKERHPRDEDGQMAHLAHTLQYASMLLHSRPAVANGVTRFVIFIKLSDFSVWTAPSIGTTLRTIRLLLDNFPERLGQCVFYRAPRAFAPLWAAAAAVIPADTLSKVVFISGDVSPGSVNAEILTATLGPTWRKLTGADQPVVVSGSSPGFDIESYWPMVEQDFARIANGEPPVGFERPLRAGAI